MGSLATYEEVQSLKEAMANLHSSLRSYDKTSSQFREIADLHGQLKGCRRKLETVRGDAESQKQLYEAEIELLTTSKKSKDRDIQCLSVIVKVQTTIEGITALERSLLQAAAEDANRQVDKLKKKLAD